MAPEGFARLKPIEKSLVVTGQCNSKMSSVHDCRERRKCCLKTVKQGIK